MNFDEISRKVKKFGQDTVTEVQKMNEVRQLNTKINEEKKFLNRLYMELGQKLYDRYKDAETPAEGFEEDFRKIGERYSVIELLQDQVRAVKGVVLCPCCNMEVSVNERFCSNCGNRMPEVVEIEEKAETDNAIVVESSVVESEAVEAEPAEEAEAAEPAVEAEPAAEAEAAETEVVEEIEAGKQVVEAEPAEEAEAAEPIVEAEPVEEAEAAEPIVEAEPAEEAEAAEPIVEAEPVEETEAAEPAAESESLPQEKEIPQS